MVPATNAGYFASQGEILFFWIRMIFSFLTRWKKWSNITSRLCRRPQRRYFSIPYLAMTSDEGIVFNLMPTKGLRTVDGKKENGPLERLSDPEAAYRHIQKMGIFAFYEKLTLVTP
jgi:hypothetical protein